MDRTDHFAGVLMDRMEHSESVTDRTDHSVEDIPGVLLLANLLSPTIADVSTISQCDEFYGRTSTVRTL